MTGLTGLSLDGLKLENLDFLLPLKRLERFELHGGGTTNLAALPRIGDLTRLVLGRINGLADVSVIEQLASLQSLDLYWLKRVETMPDLAKLKHLRRVMLDTMKGLRKLGGLAAAPELETLIIFNSAQLTPEEFLPFVGHKKLASVSIGLGSKSKNEAVRRLLGDLPPASLSTD